MIHFLFFEFVFKAQNYKELNDYIRHISKLKRQV